MMKGKYKYNDYIYLEMHIILTQMRKDKRYANLERSNQLFRKR
jgi:hypothetical protein